MLSIPIHDAELVEEKFPDMTPHQLYAFLLCDPKLRSLAFVFAKSSTEEL